MDEAVEAVHVGDLEFPVIRGRTSRAHFEFDKPGGEPHIIAPPEAPWSEVRDFCKQWGPRTRVISEKIRSYYKAPRGEHDFRTGRIMYLLGKPIVVYISDTVYRNLAGTEGTLFFYDEMNTVIMRSAPREHADTYRETYDEWADQIFCREVRKVIIDCMGQAGIRQQDLDVTVDDALDGWAHLDGTLQTLTVARQLEGYPPECIEYVFIDAAISAMVSQKDIYDVRRAVMERAKVPWQRVEYLLDDPESKYANL